MGKRKKEDEAPKRDWEQEYHQMREVAEDLVRRLRTANYVTVDRFVDEYAGALRDHMHQQYSYREHKNELHHPEDLAAAAATFADAHWNISQHIDYSHRGQ